MTSQISQLGGFLQLGCATGRHWWEIGKAEEMRRDCFPLPCVQLPLVSAEILIMMALHLQNNLVGIAVLTILSLLIYECRISSIIQTLIFFRASLVAQMVKHLTAMQETLVRSLGREDPLEKETATHSSILAWKIPCQKSLAGCTVHGVTKSQT